MTPTMTPTARFLDEAIRNSSSRAARPPGAMRCYLPSVYTVAQRSEDYVAVWSCKSLAERRQSVPESATLSGNWG